ncbi:MAG: 23S rRNA (guanosine(2251)-2'-O)-methyltransferase RlmB [Actinomycetota bacterium]
MSGPGRNRNRRSNSDGGGSSGGRGRSGATGGRQARSGGRGRGGGSGAGRGQSRDGTQPQPNRKRTQGLGGDQVEGRQAVRELLLAGRRRTKQVLIADETDNAEVLTDIAELARDLDVPFRTVARKRLAAEAATTAHQGVIAQAAPLPEADVDDLMADPRAFLLVLDGITDPGNLGALLRTAECAGVTGVILPRHRAVHISPTVTKTAAGAVEHLDLAVVGGIPAALQALSGAGVTTIGLDAGGEASIFEALTMADGPIALVLGAEGRGLSRLVRQRVDQLVAIPLAGGLNSLNVAAAAAIACFEVVRRRNPVSQ